MRATRGHRNLRSERGMAMVQTVVFGALVGFGALALAIDTGLSFNSRAELQRAADAAALAAAAQLGTGADALNNARDSAADYAAKNNVAGDASFVDDDDVVFGHAVLEDGRYVFHPNEEPFDAVQVAINRSGDDDDHPTVDLLFSKAFFNGGARISAKATAMLVPRDIALVVDLSGSMNDDSELRHYKSFESETAGTRDGVQVNLRDIWCALDGPEPARPYIPGDPAETEYAGDTGPTWGQMTQWGSQVVLGSYDATTDPGLTYLKKSVDNNSATLRTALLDRGYKQIYHSSTPSKNEVDCLVKGGTDASYSNNYRNRVKVILGLAEWKSGKKYSKYGHLVGGDGDDKVEDGELTAAVSYPSGMAGGSWDDWVNYVAGTNMMTETDDNLRYRFGLKTFVNYLLEKRSKNSFTPQLVGSPELPMRSVKDAVQTMIDTIVELETQDRCSLEVFATTSRHEVDLSVPDAGQSLAEALQAVPDALYQRQAGHYDSTTNIGAGVHEAIQELQSDRARSAAAKVIIVLTDGKPNVGGSGMGAEDYAVDRVTYAAQQNMTVYTVGVGSDCYPSFLQNLANIGKGEFFFADGTPDPVTGQPQYVEELDEIFQQLGGKRPVRLIN